MIQRIIILVCFMVGSAVAGDALFVAKDGSNSNTGTDWNNALLTVDAAHDAARSGDTIVFGTGVWREKLYTLENVKWMDSCYWAGDRDMDKRVAYLYGGAEKLENWTRIGATNTYRHTVTLGVTSNWIGLWQHDDSWGMDSANFLWRQADSASVDREGEWYYNPSGSIVAYIYDEGLGYDPDSYDNMEVAQEEFIVSMTAYQDTVGIHGLGFMYANHRVLSDPSVGIGWDHCSFTYNLFTHCSGRAAENAALFFNNIAMDGYDYNYIAYNTFGDIRSVGTGLPQSEESYNTDQMNFYGLRYSTIEYNKFSGHSSAYGIYFKSPADPWGGACKWDTLRFNEFTGGAGSSLIRIYGNAHHIIMYGNVFAPVYTNQVLTVGYYSQGNTDSIGHHIFYNNTIYNGDRALIQYDQESHGHTYAHWGSDWRYNVIYGATGVTIMHPDSARFWDIDSNLYYVASGTNNWEAPAYVDNNWSQWQAKGFDAHSTDNVDPGFANATAGDYSRRSANGEMNRDYDGWTATIYGAIQETATTPVIGKSRSQMSFSALEGGSLPASQTLSINNAGIDILNWQVSDNAGWLSLSPTSGTNSGQVAVSVGSMGAGSYSADITITAPGAPNSPQTVSVNYTVTEPDFDPPIISYGPDSSLATASSNRIFWQTDEPATSQVDYGQTAAYGNSTPLDNNLVTSHSVYLTGLVPETVYHFRVRSSDASGNESVGEDSAFVTTVQPDNLAVGRPVTVSGTYSGYVSGVLCDGTIDPNGGTSSTWASDESSADHWVEIDLQQLVPVGSVRLYWAYNTFSSQWMRSQQFTVQGWTGSSWSDLVTVENFAGETVTYPDTVITYDGTGTPSGFSVTVAPPGDDTTISEAGFNSAVVSRIRIFQPSSMGPAAYPSIMWLTEIEVFTDDITPPTSKL